MSSETFHVPRLKLPKIKGFLEYIISKDAIVRMQMGVHYVHLQMLRNATGVQYCSISEAPLPPDFNLALLPLLSSVLNLQYIEYSET